MGRIFENDDVYQNEVEAQLDEFFKQQDESEIELVLKALTIVLHQSSPHNTDLIDLYNTVPLGHFIRVVTLFDGRTVTFPRKNELRDSLLLAICYYYREVKGYEWEDVKRVVPLEFSPISLGLRIKSLNKFMRKKLDEIFAELDEREQSNE